MEDNIPIDLLLKLAIAAEDTLEVTEDGEDIRIKGMFSVKS